MVRDCSENISKAESAIAQTFGNFRMLEEDQKRNVGDAKERGCKAPDAALKADGYRRAGRYAVRPRTVDRVI